MLTLILSGALVLLACPTEGRRVVYREAVVRAGTSSLCYLAQLNSSNLYSGPRPVVGGAGGNLAYLSLYSCHQVSEPDLFGMRDQPLDCTNTWWTFVKSKCARRLMFLWSRAMGPHYQETNPRGISGFRTGDTGFVLLVATYVDLTLQNLDSSGLELTETSPEEAEGEPGSRLLISHRLPRLIVLGGLGGDQYWRTYAVCHRSCLARMETDDIQIKKVNIFTGSQGARARIGVLRNNGTEVEPDLVDERIVQSDGDPGGPGYLEREIERDLGTSFTDLWLECDYDTRERGRTVSMLGGLSPGREHCFSVLTYLERGQVTACHSQPTEYSVLYALDLELAAQDYQQYTADYYQAEAFDSTYEFSDYDYSWSRRRKRQVHEPLTDPLMEKFSGDNRRVGRTFLISPSLSSVIAPGEREAGDLPGGAESQHQPDQ